MILDKKQMTEEDIKLNFITPAIAKSGWQNKITMETKVQFTDGRINLKGNAAVREKPKKADYIGISALYSLSSFIAGYATPFEFSLSLAYESKIGESK